MGDDGGVMFDFPNSPTTGQTVTGGNGSVYKWDGAKWIAGVSGAGVTTWNGRAGTVTMTTADVTGAGGAPLASPTFTGIPAAPTMTAGNNSTALATTAFVTTATGNYLPLTGGALSGPLTVTGAVTASGTVTGNYVTATASVTALAVYAGQPTVTDYYMATSGNLRSINFQGVGVYAIQLDTSTGIFNFIGNSTSAATMKYDGTFQVFNTNATKPGGGSWVAPSDIRIKNIVGGYDRGLDDILRLNPVVYEYKGNNPSTKLIAADRRRFVGLVAQDVENVFPDMVMKVDSEIDGKPVSDMRNMDITELTFAMINAFRTLSERVAVLEGSR